MKPSSYVLTPHLWLKQFGEKIQANNLCTGRRALLSPEDLQALLEILEGQPPTKSALLERALAADLLLPAETPVTSPLAEGLIFALDRFLCEELKLRRKALWQEFPTAALRLEKCRSILEPRLQRDPYQTMPKTITLDYLWHNPPALFQAVTEHAWTFLERDCQSLEPYPSFGRSDFLLASAGRPLPRIDYEQQPCLPETSERRVKLASELFPQGGRALFLGDDDLLGLLWGLRQATQAEILELDDDLLVYLQPHLKETVTLVKADLKRGLPPEFRGRYELVFTDPMYEAQGMDHFLACCAEGLSDHPEARVLFSTCPALIEKGQDLPERLSKVGLSVVEHHRNFNRYPFPGYARKATIEGLCHFGAPAHLISGLLSVPFLYADLFELQKA